VQASIKVDVVLQGALPLITGSPMSASTPP